MFPSRIGYRLCPRLGQSRSTAQRRPNDRLDWYTTFSSENIGLGPNCSQVVVIQISKSTKNNETNEKQPAKAGCFPKVVYF